ncbi:AcvB/VirJ family lysyl-phosphatidylglycerol hydrolase [Sphingomonas aurantiaca]|uniref:AcvB/VirJ family lysyl-phosphatidylglycerol hydrolase n=1 Tax=Sphingomonas aurantiaca TaxID=185949 RepID=UPI002FE1D623
MNRTKHPRTAAARRWRRGAWVSGILSAIVVLFVYLAGYFDRDPVHVYPAIGVHASGAPPIAVVNFSGDMGLRFLLGASTSRGLTEHGIPVVGITTPALFAHHRTRGQLDAIVADGVRVALARTGAKRVVVMGQSYGADIVQTGLADLPSSLRPRVAGIVLILPGDTVFYRADPSGLLYDHGTPDSMGVTTGNRLGWAPLTCIYGVEETDSLCPLLSVAGVRKVGMPGGIISIMMRMDCWGMCWRRSRRWRRGRGVGFEGALACVWVPDAGSGSAPHGDTPAFAGVTGKAE